MKASITENSKVSSVLVTPSSDLRHFQESFYEAFIDLPAGLLRQIWIWDDEKKRVNLRAREEDAVIHAWVCEEKILGFAAGVADEGTYFSQYRHFGFSYPGHERCFEVLTLFRCRQFLSLGMDMNTDFLIPQCYPFLREKNFETVLGTCTERVLPVYKRWGWELLEEKSIGEYRRFFIRKEL